MNSDLKKHQLLELLSLQRQNSATPLGLGYEEIQKKLNIDRSYLDFISGELYGNDEIKFFEDSQYKKGLCCTRTGVLSYSSQKYIRRKRDDRWNEVKNWVQTLIPVLSLLIAILALTSDFSINRTELKENETPHTDLTKQRDISIKEPATKDTLNPK